jgi:bacillithiol system protein YtxJ
MNWNQLNTNDQIADIITASETHPILIFKHSTRCSISSMAESRLNRSWKPSEVSSMELYHLDLISYRDLSNEIATTFKVPHESPQILIISEGKCIYNNSHMGISFHEIKRVFDGLPVA